MLVECPACRGRKRVMKIGMHDGDCTQCRGAGKVTPDERDALLAPFKNIEIKDDKITSTTSDKDVVIEIKAKDSENHDKKKKT